MQKHKTKKELKELFLETCKENFETIATLALVAFCLKDGEF
ncbi:MAG: hypothetical protein AAF487_08060 [Bacteroidota bacterium]